MTIAHEGAAARALIALIVLFLLGCGCGCASTTTMRTARVLPQGETELVAGGGAGVFVADPNSIYANPLAWPAYPRLELSLRRGIAEGLDLQLRVDELVTPEVSLGWQFLGGAATGDGAATVTAGARVGLVGTEVPLPIMTMPIQLLVDTPGRELIFTFGARMVAGVVPAIYGTSSRLTLTPGASVAARWLMQDKSSLIVEAGGAWQEAVSSAPRGERANYSGGAVLSLTAAYAWTDVAATSAPPLGPAGAQLGVGVGAGIGLVGGMVVGVGAAVALLVTGGASAADQLGIFLAGNFLLLNTLPIGAIAGASVGASVGAAMGTADGHAASAAWAGAVGGTAGVLVIAVGTYGALLVARDAGQSALVVLGVGVGGGVAVTGLTAAYLEPALQ